MKRLYLLIILTCIYLFSQAKGKIETFWDLMPEMYNFTIYEPDGYDPVNSTNVPLVMFLHGRSMSEGLNGVNYGPITSIQQGFEILGQKAIILEPNSKAGQGWASSKIHKVYEFVKAHYAFDHDKFYVIGMSMGGWGTLNYVNTYPDEVAACIGIGGGCDAKTPCGLNKVPTWIIHAADDDVTSVSNSDRVVEAMKNCGSTNLLKYSRLTSGGHSLIYYFQYRNLYDWLFSHNLKNRRFNTSIDFVNNPEVRTNDSRYWLGGDVYEEYVDITASELAKIKARTPRTGQSSGNNSTNTTANSSTTTKPTTPTTTTTTTSSTKPTSQPSKPTTTTSKPAGAKPTTTSKPISSTTSSNAKPAKQSATASKPAANQSATITNSYTYTVKQGDTLKKIAKKYKTSVKKLRKINHFTKDKKIKPGDKIKYK